MGQPSIPALYAECNRSVDMARKIVNTKKISHEEWLELRKKSIGGSDAGTCVNMNSYSSLITLYADKKGLSKEKDTSEAMRLGTDLEAYVAERFCEKEGKKVINDTFMYMDDEYDFITANVDRKVVGEKAGLECKTMGSFNGYNLEAGEIPSHYFCQCQHYMMVMGYERMYLAILVLQRGLYVIEIERDDDFIKQLREAEIDFWTNYVEPGKIPAPDGSEASLETLKQLYPQSESNTEVMVPGLDRLVRDYKAFKSMADEYKEKAEKCKAIICSKLGDAEIGIGNEFGCSWKTQSKTTGYDMKRLQEDYPAINIDRYKNVSEYRVFRTKTLKKK